MCRAHPLCSPTTRPRPCEAHVNEPDPNPAGDPAVAPSAHREQNGEDATTKRRYRWAYTDQVEPLSSRSTLAALPSSNCVTIVCPVRQIHGVRGQNRTKWTSGSTASPASSRRAGTSSASLFPSDCIVQVLTGSQGGKSAGFEALRVPDRSQLLLQRPGALLRRRAALHALPTAHRKCSTFPPHTRSN